MFQGTFFVTVYAFWYVNLFNFFFIHKILPLLQVSPLIYVLISDFNLEKKKYWLFISNMYIQTLLGLTVVNGFLCYYKVTFKVCLICTQDLTRVMSILRQLQLSWWKNPEYPNMNNNLPHVTEWVSDSCLTPNDKFVSYIIARTSWPLCCLFFDLRILITPLVSSNSSKNSRSCVTNISLLLFQWNDFMLFVDYK